MDETKTTLGLIKEPKLDLQQLCYNRIRFTVEMFDSLTETEQNATYELLTQRLQLARLSKIMKDDTQSEKAKVVAAVMIMDDFTSMLHGRLDFVCRAYDAIKEKMKCFYLYSISPERRGILFFAKWPKKTSLFGQMYGEKGLDDIRSIDMFDSMMKAFSVPVFDWYIYEEVINGIKKWVMKPITSILSAG